MTPIRLGVVGAGSMGQHHVRIWSEMSGVKLAGIVETDEVRGGQLAEQYKTKLYTHYKEMLDEVDAVSIVVPSSLHYPCARDFG
ncbi:MAG: Gfo/Idh/MocA family protein [Candidatus Xenobia bacterium]